MTTMRPAPRRQGQTLIIAGRRYELVADLGEVIGGLPASLKRSWTLEPLPVQNVEDDREFELPLRSFAKGAGFTFADVDGVYEIADGWDATGPTTWPRYATGDATSTVNARGYLVYFKGFLYLLRGRYSVKYRVQQQAGAWPVLERFDFGALDAGAIVAGRPAIFAGQLYVPLRSSVDGSILRWARLSEVNDHVDEVQTLAITGAPTSGTWTVTYQGSTTAALALEATAEEVQIALRALPGLQDVTVVRSGTAPNYTYTVTLVGAGGALGSDSPPQLTTANVFNVGDVAVATTVPGQADRWERGPAGKEALMFGFWQHPISGPVLVRALANTISMAALDPLNPTNWGADYEVGDADGVVTAIIPYDRDIVIGKGDGRLYVFDAQAIARPLIDVVGVGNDQEWINAHVWFGHLYLPSLTGLWRWRPGGARKVGPEQDGEIEGARSSGWGRVTGLAAHGDRLYYVAQDPFRSQGIVGSFAPEPRSGRNPLTPHIHHVIDGAVEDVTVIHQETLPAEPRAFASVVDDDGGIAGIAWSNPEHAQRDDETFASATPAAPPALTHYLKATLAGLTLPDNATVKGIEVRVRRRKRATSTIEFIGTGSPSSGGPGSPSPLFLSEPAGTQVGDLMVAVVSVDTFGITEPGGWSIVTGEGGTVWYYRVKQAGDPSIWQWQGQNVNVINGQMLAFRNVDPANPIAGFTNNNGRTPGSGMCTLTFDPITTSLDDEYALLLGMAHGASGSAFSWTSLPTPGSWTKHLDGQSPGGLSARSWAAFGRLTGPVGEFPSTSVTYFFSQTDGDRATIVRLRPKDQGDVVDQTVRLLKGGAQVGDNRAAVGQWPANVFTDQTYGGPADLWGTTWSPSEINANDFGIVFNASIGAGTADVQFIEVFVHYTVEGLADVGQMLAVLRVDAAHTVAQPYIYQLPRAGLTPANDPFVVKAASGAELRTARYAAPGREIAKTYRAVELWLEAAPESGTPGLLVEASVDDGDWFQLLQSAEGDEPVPAFLRTSGFHRVFFPPDERAVGRWVQLRLRVPETVAGEVPMAVRLRDLVMRGSYRADNSLLHTFVVRLRQGQRYGDGAMEDRTVAQQLDDVLALAGREAAPIPFRRPDGRDGYGEVIAVQVHEVNFKGGSAPEWVAVLRMREAPYR